MGDKPTKGFDEFDFVWIDEEENKMKTDEQFKVQLMNELPPTPNPKYARIASVDYVSLEYVSWDNERQSKIIAQKDAEITKWKKEASIEGRSKSVAQELIKWHQGEYDKLKIDLDLNKGLSNAHLELNREMHQQVKLLEQKLAVAIEALEKIEGDLSIITGSQMICVAEEAMEKIKGEG